MKVHLTASYKSLSHFKSEELPDFTVIIGKNGSGKSQLVQKFNQYAKAKTKKELEKVFFLIEPPVNSVYTDTLVVERLTDATPSTYRAQFDKLISEYSNCIYSDPIRKAWLNLLKKGIPSESVAAFELKEFEGVYALKDLVSTDESRFVNSDLEYLGMASEVGIDRNTVATYNIFLADLKRSLIVFEVAKHIASHHKKSIVDLYDNDFLTSDLPDKYLEKNHLIDSKIEDIFYNYLRKRHNNDLNFLRKSQYKVDNSSISVEEFDRLYKNPIIQINEILASLNMEYYFREISSSEFLPDSTVRFDFLKKSSQVKVQFNDLSSGEKIILGVIIRLFTSVFYNADLKFPELIILDEPDAHLHPEMCTTLIKVLNDQFSKKLGIKVILTTHSPVTVALSPDDSIFQLENEPTTFLKKIEKDRALKILTQGVPNLSIDYQNHRQVFVESPTDLNYYQTLFDKFSSRNTCTHQLYFISNGYGKSNCEQVKKIVKDLRSSGNNTAYGIIDWDKKNTDSSLVFVHGLNQRYSIENYIFDPIYVGILLIE
ncbi:MAG: AAA family ATPase, partial [Nitrososphaeraceae archaeon]